MAQDIRINLLPWREELRERKKREFLNITLAVLALAGATFFGADRFYNSVIDSQQARNDFLDREIRVLDERIKEFKLLRQTRKKLLSRMRVIRQLQGHRPIIVRVFDELARQLAPGVFFTDLAMKGEILSITGVAESNNRISDQLRNFSESAWFDSPNVTEIKASPRHGTRASQFSLTAIRATPKKQNREAI